MNIKINPYEETKKLKWKYANWDNFKALQGLLQSKVETGRFYDYRDLKSLFNDLSSQAKVYQQTDLYMLHLKLFFNVTKSEESNIFGCILAPKN